MHMNGQAQSIGKVRRQPLSNQTADLLRASIGQGMLVPGTRLIETDIAEELGVSRGILREALRMLEQEGLVESYPGKGTFVTRPTERDIQEIYSLRQLLEEKATLLAAQNATNEDIAHLEGIYDQMLESARLDDLATVVEKDLEFHQKIWDMADHIRLKNVLEELKVHITVFLNVNTKLYKDLATGVADHKAILEDIRNKDGENASRRMIAHLDVAAGLVTDFIRGIQKDLGT